MKLKEIREKRNISQSELARRIGLKPQSINQYESNKRQMSLETLLKVIKILDCSADELLDIKKNKRDE